ncbi:MAG: hypothetical protein H8Z69_04545 [Nanohaloarchaea archaeon]|nr:hypothetical protein [Candidatus Nanohaloarchaea archaeon]
MEYRDLVLLASIFVLATGAGALIGQSFQSEPVEQRYSKLLDVRVNSSTQVATASFDNRSINLMYESSDKAGMYIDVNRDGSFDKRLNGLVRDGEEHTKVELLGLDSDGYMLYFRYSDNSSVSEDGSLELYQVRKF